jgi:hypothetical protein
MIRFLLRGKIESLKNTFDELEYEIKLINDRTLEYTQLYDDHETEKFIREHKIISNSIGELLIEMKNIFKDKDYGVPIVHCQYKDHCEQCSKHQIDNVDDYDFCMSVCNTCKLFRKLKDKESETVLTKYYNDNISKNQQVQSKKTSNIININNNLIINVNNYIQTRDPFYYVTITSEQDNPEEQLRYIFTYLMCGLSGKSLFPNEKKHSKAVTYTVIAAKYNIITDNKNTVLHGLLRYKYNNINSMTINKLEKMGNNNYIVKAYAPNICNNNKAQISRDDIDCYINNIVGSENGSDINNFYIC